MKELYTTPEVEVVTFDTMDVITTSEPVADLIPTLPLDEF